MNSDQSPEEPEERINPEVEAEKDTGASLGDPAPPSVSSTTTSSPRQKKRAASLSLDEMKTPSPKKVRSNMV